MLSIIHIWSSNESESKQRVALYVSEQLEAILWMLKLIKNELYKISIEFIKVSHEYV